MEDVPGNGDAFRQDNEEPCELSSTQQQHLHHQNHSSQHHPPLVEMAVVASDEQGKESNALKEHQLIPTSPRPPQLLHQDHQQPYDQRIVHGKTLFQEPNEPPKQDRPNQHEQELQDRLERTSTGVSLVPPMPIATNEGLNENLGKDHPQHGANKVAVEITEERQTPDQHEPAATDTPKTAISASLMAPEVLVAPENKGSGTATTSAAKPKILDVSTTTTACKRVPKRPRAKPGFGLRTSRTTIVETGQKRRSCICTNSKLCNELMTKWAKVSPPDYHYVQLPREHNPAPSMGQLSMETESHHSGGVARGKNNGSGESSAIPENGNVQHPSNSNNNNNMSETDTYKNGFRHATLRNIQAKNPLPKDERVALCHYHPEVRPYLFWPKNTPSAQKYAIPMSLAIQLGYDTVANKCKGFNTEKYCYVVPTYSFEDAKAEIGSVEKAFYDRVRQIKTNPTQFVRDLRQCEEELKEVHKLRRRNAELLRRLDDRRRSIKRLRSVVHVQRTQSKEAQQQQQLAAQAVSVNAQTHAVSNNNTVQQQYQQHTYQTQPSYHHQQQLVDPSQQQQQTAGVPQPLGQQNHNQLFQPPPLTQEQQTIGIVVGGINQNNEQQHQQHEQQHHWTYTQYNANGMAGPPTSENEQQHSQQQVQLAPVHPFDPTQQQQQPVPSPMDDHNNPGNNLSYAQQLEAAMAAAVAAGFKDGEEEEDHHHHHHGDLVGDVVDLDDLEHHDGFGGDHGDDDGLEDDDWSDTEYYRQSTGGGASQNDQRPRKWPRKTVVLPSVSTEVEDIPKRVKRNSKSASGNNKKRVKKTKPITTTKSKKAPL